MTGGTEVGKKKESTKSFAVLLIGVVVVVAVAVAVAVAVLLLLPFTNIILVHIGGLR